MNKPIRLSRFRRSDGRHISPATPIAMLALVISLSGTAWAVSSINGSQLANRSVSHVKLDRHSVTAAELNFTHLGVVPSARKAHSAASLGGVPASQYTQDVWATQTSKPLTVQSSKKFSTILKQPFVNHAPKAAGFLNFTEVQATNVDKGGPVTLTIGLEIDGQREPGTYSDTIGVGDTQSMFAVLKCNGMPPGRHTIGVVAESTGMIELGTRADDGLRPIVVPPGGRSTFTGEG
jgi:hypothetical protein